MKNLRTLFDYQKFEGNSRLASMIEATESKYLKKREELDDEDLFLVNAAGSKEQFMNDDAPDFTPFADPFGDPFGDSFE